MVDAVGVISVNCACIICLVKDRFVRSCSMYWQRGKKPPDASHSLFIARRIMSPRADWHSQPPRSYGFLWCWRGHPPLHLKHLCKSRPFASTSPKKKGLGAQKGFSEQSCACMESCNRPSSTQNQNNYIFTKVWSCKMRLKMNKWK